MPLSIVAATIASAVSSQWTSLVLCVLLTALVVFWAVIAVRDDGEDATTSTPTATTDDSPNDDSNDKKHNQHQKHQEASLQADIAPPTSHAAIQSTSFVVDVGAEPTDCHSAITNVDHTEEPYVPALLAALVGTGSHLAAIFTGMALGCALRNRGIMYPEYPDADTLAAVSQGVFNVYANTSYLGGGIAMLACCTMARRRQSDGSTVVVLTTAHRVLTMVLTATLFPGVVIAVGAVLGHLCTKITEPSSSTSSTSSAALYAILQQWVCVSIPLSLTGAIVYSYLCSPQLSNKSKVDCSNGNKEVTSEYDAIVAVTVLSSPSTPPTFCEHARTTCLNAVVTLCIGLSPFVVVLPQLPVLLLLWPVPCSQSGDEESNHHFNLLGLVHIALFYISIAAASIALSGFLRIGRWGQCLSGVVPAVYMYVYCLVSYLRNPPPSHQQQSELPFATYFSIYAAMMCGSLGLAGGAVAFWAPVWAGRRTHHASRQGASQ